MVPSLKLEKEERRISAKSTPLAPNTLTPGNRMKFARPVMNAVEAMIHIMSVVPYFSSNKGPTTKIKVKLLIKCDQLA